MSRRWSLVVAILAWPLCAWLYMTLGRLELVVNATTGEKYCTNRLAEQLGIADIEWLRVGLLIGSLIATIAIPLILASSALWFHARRNKPR